MFKSIFNQFIITLTPHLPLSIVRAIAGRYVAGETIDEALEVVEGLNKKGFTVTLDILGEHTKSAEEALHITTEYLTLYDEIKSRGLECNLSIKPTHIGLDVDKTCAEDNLIKLLNKAEETGNFLRIDMENSVVTDITINLYEECKKRYTGVGTVFQAYLYRTENDLRNLFKNGSLNFRLCKGIYRESPQIAIQKRKDINRNFLKLLQYAFENNLYVGIATHDLELLVRSYELIESLKVPSDRFEFQVLYGVPMSGWLEKHLERGYKIRIYVAFGKDWYDYSIRRLKENPNIAGYILKDIFRK